MGVGFPDPSYSLLITKEWRFHNQAPWVQPKTGNPRQATIVFPKAFEQPPKVVVWLTSVSGPPGKTLGIRVTTEAITATGFTMSFLGLTGDTLNGSSNNCAAATWLAHPADSPHLRSGYFGLPGDRPARTTVTAAATFDPPIAFPRLPRVLVGFSSLRCGENRPARASVNVGDIRSSGFQWFISTSGYSVLFEATAGYIALE
jgi:hypothetical protein